MLTVWDDVAWPCKTCTALTRDLASSTFEAVAVQGEISASVTRDFYREFDDPLAAQYRLASRHQRDANDALRDHLLSQHGIVR